MRLARMVTVAASWAWSGAASAGTSLDYGVVDGCPSGPSFSSSVSERLGEAAFDPAGARMVVRIAAGAAGELVGTLELGAESRVVRGWSCDEVFDGLVVAATDLLRPSPRPEVSAAPTVGSGPVQVTLSSRKPGLTVALTDRGTHDQCYSPCTFDVPPGIHEISTYGKGTRAVRLKMAFEQPEVALEARTVSVVPLVGGIALSGSGALSAMFGGTLLLGCGNQQYQRSCTPGGALLASGAALGAIGLPLILHNGRIRVVDPR